MCDIDFFKKTNDAYSHDVSDMVLRETADNIKKIERASDLVIRKIEESKLRIADGFMQKTISIGVSEFPTDTQKFWNAIKFADIALYKAKERGRNRVVRFTLDMWTEENS